MVDVVLNYNVADNCQVNATLVEVTSSEAANATADGNTAPDWEIVDAHHLKLRAERSGRGNGRIYTLTIRATDGVGNSTSKAVTVRVPKDK
jgi:hypothetical protein